MPSLLNLARVLPPLLQLKKLPDIPVPTLVEHRGSQHNSGGAPFPNRELEMRVPFPASSEKNSGYFRRISRGGAHNRKAEFSWGRGTILKAP